MPHLDCTRCSCDDNNTRSLAARLAAIAAHDHAHPESIPSTSVVMANMKDSTGIVGGSMMETAKAIMISSLRAAPLPASSTLHAQCPLQYNLVAAALPMHPKNAAFPKQIVWVRTELPAGTTFGTHAHPGPPR